MHHDARSQVTGNESGGVIKVVLFYAVFASLWVLLSEKTVEWIFRDPEKIVVAGAIKGWLFVAATSLLLYWLMRRLIGATTLKSKPPSVTGLRRLLPLALIALAIILLTSGTIIFTFNQEKSKEADRLQAIAELKAGQISDWLRERDGDMHFVQTSRFFAEAYRHWADKADGSNAEVLKERLNEFREDKSFKRVLLFDEKSKLLWSSETAAPAVNSALQSAAQVAETEGRALRVGPYRGADGRLRLDLIAPLLLVGTNPCPAVVLRVDPEEYLFPALQTWPVPSASGETLLFRRDGDQVLYLNELRHLKGAAAMLHMPITEKDLLSAKVLRGEAKLGSPVEGVDYRGVRVMGVARAISGTDWLLLAKIDQSEFQLAAASQALWIGMAGLLALFMAATGSFIFRQHQELAFSLREREDQAENLRALQLLDAIAEGSRDAIFAKDRHGRYMLFNREAASITGKKADEVIGQDDSVLFSPEQTETIKSNDRQVMEEGSTITFQERLTTPSGEITFLVTKGPLRDAEGKVIGMFGISHDITELMHAEKALRESEELYRTLVSLSPDAISMADLNGLLTFISPKALQMFGYFSDEEILGQDLSNWVAPEER